MKKQISLVLLAVLTVGLFASCNKIFFPEADELPANAQQFINQYFPNNNILYFEKDGGSYDVKLSGNVELDFNLNGDWTEVDCNLNEVPAGIVPTEIADYVATNYPNNFIVKISRNGQHYEIELNNDIDLDFNLGNNNGGNGGNGGNNNGGNGNGGNNGGNGNTQVTLPDAAQLFLNQYFANIAIVHIELDDYKYEVRLSNGVEIDFNMNGNWIEIDCNTLAVPAGIVPQNIVDFVTISYPNNFIVKISKEYQKYEIELNNHLDLVFDLNGNFLYID